MSDDVNKCAFCDKVFSRKEESRIAYWNGFGWGYFCLACASISFHKRYMAVPDTGKIDRDFCMWLHENFDEIIKELGAVG